MRPTGGLAAGNLFLIFSGYGRAPLQNPSPLRPAPPPAAGIRR